MDVVLKCNRFMLFESSSLKLVFLVLMENLKITISFIFFKGIVKYEKIFLIEKKLLILKIFLNDKNINKLEKMSFLRVLICANVITEK